MTTGAFFLVPFSFTVSRKTLLLITQVRKSRVKAVFYMCKTLLIHPDSWLGYLCP